MTKEEKELLVSDLFARLPYGVKCSINGVLCEIARVDVERKQLYLKKADGHGGTYSIARGDVPKQYLRPMSSMTEEERNEYLSTKMQETERVALAEIYRSEAISIIMDWLNAHYFDYRGLIQKGLALEAPEGMYEIAQTVYNPQKQTDTENLKNA